MFPISSKFSSIFVASVIVSSDNLNAVDLEIPIEPHQNHPHTETLPNSDYNNEPDDPIRTNPTENVEQIVNVVEENIVHELKSEEIRAECTYSDAIAGDQLSEDLENAPIQDTLADANNISDNL